MELLIVLAPFLMELFKNCNEKDNMAKAQRVSKGGSLVRGRIRRSLRKNGSRGKKLRREVDDAMADIKSASVLEIKDSLDEMCETCGVSESDI